MHVTLTSLCNHHISGLSIRFPLKQNQSGEGLRSVPCNLAQTVHAQWKIGVAGRGTTGQNLTCSDCPVSPCCAAFLALLARGRTGAPGQLVQRPDFTLVHPNLAGIPLFVGPSGRTGRDGVKIFAFGAAPGTAGRKLLYIQIPIAESF